MKVGGGKVTLFFLKPIYPILLQFSLWRFGYIERVTVMVEVKSLTGLYQNESKLVKRYIGIFNVLDLIFFLCFTSVTVVFIITLMVISLFD